MTKQARIVNGAVTLPVTVNGAGKKLIFFNGVGATQVVWKGVIAGLTGRYEIVTFDFRGHGGASAAKDHSFEGFLSDADAVMSEVGSGKPIVVAWSFGADLAVAWAAAHPGALGGLLIVDGALPIAEPLVDDEARLRRVLNSFSMKLSIALMQLTPYRYSLSGADIADITMTADAHRQGMIDLYGQIDCPIAMVLATKTGGENTTDNNRRKNRIWREAGERLSARYPAIAMTWIDAGHRLPLSKPGELAQFIDDFASQVA
jgi:pimeloyl-ACP methyl ester carboxylesterase